MYRKELGDWIHDDRRRKEQESEAARDQRTPLYGHESVEKGRSEGFDPESFDLKDVLRTSKSRPAH